MALSIKNEETHRLVQELANVAGESLTTAITIAVRERLERLQRPDRAALAIRLQAIGRECAAHLREPFLTAEHGDLLYDVQGLPE